METIGPEKLSFQARFMFDNVTDGIKDQSLLMWQALDTDTGKVVWIIGRRVKDKVLPLALLLENSGETVKRYAPATGPGEYDFSLIPKLIIRP